MDSRRGAEAHIKQPEAVIRIELGLFQAKPFYSRITPQSEEPAWKVTPCRVGESIKAILIR